MASQIGIANWALIKLGSERISDLADDSERAETISDIWDMTRDDELRARNWRFAIKRVSLPADVATPDWGFSSQYTLPGECVRVIQAGEFWFSDIALDAPATGETAPYLIEGDKILTDVASAGELAIRYMANDVDIGIWDGSFAHAFACRLAVELCERLTEAHSKTDRAKAWYKEAVRTASRANAIEHPPRRIVESTWVTSRFRV